MITTTDFNLAAARAAHAHLRRLHDGLRTQVVHAWLVENRGHHKAKHVDELMTDFRLGGVADALDDAEALVDRHSGSHA